MLAGRRIVNTRATHQHSRLSTLLRERGAEPLEYPCIALAPPADPSPLDAALAQLATYDWLVLTSANAVEAISSRWAISQTISPARSFLAADPLPLFAPSSQEEGSKAGIQNKSSSARGTRETGEEDSEPKRAGDGRAGDGRAGDGRAGDGRCHPAIAAVGPSTAKAVRERLGVEPTLLPETFTAEALAKVLPVQPGERVLIPASALARPALAERLRERGADVTVVEAYQTVLGEGGEDVPQLLRTHTVDAITFTSASTVTNFLTRLEREGGNRADLAGVCLVSIGPQTTAEAQRLGLNPTREAHVHTLDGLIAILNEYFA